MNNQLKETGKDYIGSLPVFCLSASSNKNQIKTYPAISCRKLLRSPEIGSHPYIVHVGAVTASGCFRR